MMSQRHEHTSSGRLAPLRAIGVASACGLDIAVLVVAGILIGQAVDARMHSAPCGLLVGLFVGLGCGLYAAYRIMAPFIRTL